MELLILVLVGAIIVTAVADRRDMQPALALLLGAIVAPPDAATAVAIGRKLGLPKRFMTILTGESLVNDAAALSLCAIAISQIANTHSFIGNPLLLFGYNAISVRSSVRSSATSLSGSAGICVTRRWKPCRASSYRSLHSSPPNTCTTPTRSDTTTNRPRAPSRSCMSPPTM